MQIVTIRNCIVSARVALSVQFDRKIIDSRHHFANYQILQLILRFGHQRKREGSEVGFKQSGSRVGATRRPRARTARHRYAGDGTGTPGRWRLRISYPLELN